MPSQKYCAGPVEDRSTGQGRQCLRTVVGDETFCHHRREQSISTPSDTNGGGSGRGYNSRKYGDGGGENGSDSGGGHSGRDVIGGVCNDGDNKNPCIATEHTP